jgi:glycosyltransferase involved in cell wall biosynthesis
MRAARQIVIVYAGYLGRGGGVAQHVRQLRQDAERRGDEPIVLSLDSLPSGVRLLPHVVRQSLNSVAAPWGTLLRYRVGRALLASRIRRLIAGGGVRAVVFEDIYTAFPVPVPALAVLHALETHNLQGIAVTPARLAAARRAEAAWLASIPFPVAAVSAAYRTVVESDLRAVGARVRQLETVPLGIDVSPFPDPPQGRTSARLEVVFLGFLVARKNLPLLAEVAGALRERIDYRLTIIGDGPLRPALEGWLAQRGVATSVEWLGQLPHAEVPRRLQAFHTMVHPSAVESFAYGLLEGKLAGVWTTTSPGLAVPPEFCDAVIAGDAAAWADHIAKHRQLYMEPLSAERLAEVRELRRQYDATKMCEAYRALLGLDR